MAAWYNLHGISIRVSAHAQVADAIGQRLLRFASQEDGVPDLDFVFTHAVAVPAMQGEGRCVYEWNDGAILYDPCTDILKARIHEAVGMVCHVSTGRTSYVMKAEKEASRLASHILFTLPLIELLRRRGLFNVHAAALCRGNDAILLAGTSGAGKSTLTLAMAKAGWDYMGDDMVFLKPDSAELYGFPEGIDLSTEPAGHGAKSHVRPEKVFGTVEILHGRPRALIFPRVAHTPASVLTPISPMEAFMELAPNVVMSERTTCERHFKALEDLTRRTPAFRLSTGYDLHEARLKIGDLFEQLVPQSAHAPQL